MTNINCDKNTLLFLKDSLNYFQNNSLTKSYLEETLKNLLPSKDGKLLINYKINENGFSTAKFIPYTKCINISLNKVNEWLNRNSADLKMNLKESSINILKSYLFIFMLTHEIEHSYQYLMANEIIDAPSDVLKNAYKGIFDLLVPKDYIIPRPISRIKEAISLILYKQNENLYLLERNANIESMDLVSKCAKFNDIEDIFKLFDDMKRTYLKCGYIDSCIGSIEETYRKILMHSKYKKFYKKVDLSEEKKVRYGFKIGEETRKKLIK